MSQAGEQGVGVPNDLRPEVAALFGADFLDFVLSGVAPSKVLSGDAPRRQVLDALQRIGVQVLSYGDDATRTSLLLRLLVEQGSEELPTPLLMRKITGGDLPDLPEDDPVSNALTALALAAYPLQLLKVSPNDPFTFGVATTLIDQNKAGDAFARAVYDDPILKGLFPDPMGESAAGQHSFPNEIDVNLIWSSGAGGSLSLGSLASSALDFTFTQMRLGDELRLDNVPSFARLTVDIMRKLVKDRRARVPMIVSFSNLSLAPGVVAVVGGGRLLAADSMRGHIRSVDQQTTAVFASDVELRLLEIVPREHFHDGSSPGDDTFHRRLRHRAGTIDAGNQAYEREVTRFRLAVALASGNDSLLAPSFRARSIIHPLSGGTYSWSFNPFPMSLTPPGQVDESMVESLEDWGRRVAVHPDTMWVGARRLLSAMAERRDPLDAFIDAVVCWENLLGSDTEVTFRVCAGLSTLIEPDDMTRRLQLFDELKGLYVVRSRLVHGGKEPLPAESHSHAQRAIRIAINAMREIYYRPELLGAGSSQVRTRRLLLGA